ncbi:hypothetical protein VP01_1687g4 [Puccinia sorghi]|uniref:Uncharacterized protein n=1 Tax=Puccinia sorghi TaxID=27349 RepID=A0A0L6VFZ3_9BASI|nr:hypothetical protein VP01_1687g4 [Puccinia sorghi]
MTRQCPFSSILTNVVLLNTQDAWTAQNVTAVMEFTAHFVDETFGWFI